MAAEVGAFSASGGAVGPHFADRSVARPASAAGYVRAGTVHDDRHVALKAGKAIPPWRIRPTSPTIRSSQVAIAQALTSVAKFVWPLPDRGLRRRLPRITAQTLVIAGADDRFVPASYVEEFASRIRDAGMAIIPDAAHMVPYEQPAEVFGKLDGWVAAKVRAA